MANDYNAGGKEYPGKPEFMGSNGTMLKVGDAFLQGTGINVPDHVGKNEKELLFPHSLTDSPASKDNQLHGT